MFQETCHVHTRVPMFLHNISDCPPATGCHTLCAKVKKYTYSLKIIFQFKYSPIKSESAIAELGPRMFVFNQI